MYYSGLGEQRRPPFSRKKHAKPPNLSPLTSPRLHNVTLERSFQVSFVVLCPVSNVKVWAESLLYPPSPLPPPCSALPLYRCRSELFQHRGAVRSEPLLFKVEQSVFFFFFFPLPPSLLHNLICAGEYIGFMTEYLKPLAIVSTWLWKYLCCIFRFLLLNFRFPRQTRLAKRRFRGGDLKCVHPVDFSVYLYFFDDRVHVRVYSALKECVVFLFFNISLVTS